jgi:hypothetical protein
VVAPPNTSAPKAQKEFKFFAFLSDSAYTSVEQISLWVVLAIAVAGLLYAVMLAGQVYGADEGTEKMREVGAELLGGAWQKNAQGNAELETALRKKLIAARCGRGDAVQDAVVRRLLLRQEVANHLTAFGLVGNLAMTGKADGQHLRKLHERIGSLGN